MNTSLKLPFIVEADPDPEQFQRILPRFPNWEKSFVSGPESPLYETSHWENPKDKSLVLTIARFKGAALGPPGHVHGGATAGIIDEVMGICVWHQGEKAVTQELELRYLKPVPLQIEALIYTRIIHTFAKTVEVHATLYDQKKIPRVSARGIFHRLSDQQLAKFKP